LKMKITVQAGVEGKMAGLISNRQSTVTRRGAFIGATASLLCAPAIVRAAGLMPVRGVILPVELRKFEKISEMPQEGFWRRVMFAACDRDLKEGRTESSIIVNYHRLSETEMCDLVAYAQKYGFLK
jgi:hypothetical protein